MAKGGSMDERQELQAALGILAKMNPGALDHLADLALALLLGDHERARALELDTFGRVVLMEALGANWGER
jgi:hypothetical protein